MGRAAFGIVRPGIVQAQLPVHRQPDIFRVAVLLAVVFPPADWTQPHRSGGVKCLMSAAGATIECRDRLHGLMDEKPRGPDYRRMPLRSPALAPWSRPHAWVGDGGNIDSAQVNKMQRDPPGEKLRADS